MRITPDRSVPLLLLLFVVLALSQEARTQPCTPPTQRLRMLINDAGLETDSIFFGHSPTATRGLDPQLCETEFPPFPPSGTFEARFVNPPGYDGIDVPLGMGQGFKLDYRRYITRAQVDTHKIKFQAGVSGYPMTLRWSPAALLAICDSARLQDEFGGILIKKNMKLDSVLVVTQPTIGTLLLIKYGAIQPITFPLFSITPTNLVFGNVDVAASKVDSVFVTNPGSAPLTISLAASTDPAFSVAPSSISSIPPGESRKFTVTFTPSSVGPRTGAIVFTHDAAGSPDSITVSGTGVIPGPIFQVTPLTLNFGLVVVSTSRTDSVLVSNLGTLPLTIASVSSSNADFSVTPSGAGPIPPLGSQKFYVTFTPAALGAGSSTIVFSHNADGSPDTVTVSGNGVAPGPLFTVNPPALNFYTLGLGSNKTDSVVITNFGTQPLNVTQAASDQSEFSVSPRSATGIPPLGTRKFYITFSPLTAGAKAGNIIFTHNATGSPDSVPVSGNAIVPAPIFLVQPESLDFGSVPVFSGRVESLKVTNVGTLPLNVTSVVSDSPDFSVTPSSAGPIPANGARRFLVTFSPTTYGPKNGTLLFSHNGTSSPDTVLMQGIAPEPLFAVDPSTVNFGSVNLFSSRVETVQVHNPGAAPLVITVVASNNTEFSVTPTSGGPIAPADSQAFAITITPTSLGPKSGSILFVHNATSSPDSVLVSGTGVQPAFVVTPTQVTFDSTGVTISVIDSVLVTNPGSATLHIDSVRSDNPLHFSVSPAGPVAIAPAGGRKFAIRFRPLATGPLSAGIVFFHDAPTTPDSVMAAGIGVPLLFLTIPPETLAAKDPIRGRFLKPVKRGKHLYPNWANLIEETVAQGGFQPGATESDSAGGLRLGISSMVKTNPSNPLSPKWKPVKDSAAIRCWVRIGTWDFKKSVGKSANKIPGTLENRTFKHLGSPGPARGLDSSGSPGEPKRKRLVKQQTKLDPKKTPNRLFAELLALKFNIAASQLGKTPNGFDALMYTMPGSPFDGYTLRKLSRRADTLMTYWRTGLSSQTLYDSLFAVLYRINRAFNGPLDTVTFEGPTTLVLKGKGDLAQVPFLTAGSEPAGILLRTSSATETEEDMDIEDPDGEGIALETRLYQNYPNPFNPTTTVGFRLIEPLQVTLKVYDILGREVATLLEGEELDEGFHEVEFDATGLASGVYFCRFHTRPVEPGQAGETMNVRKLLLLK
jgi:hypothetical protein